jgi:bifunctional polynucleotide phosphatase/kinase
MDAALTRPHFEVYPRKVRDKLISTLTKILKDEKMMILMIGSQASGKSTLATALSEKLKNIICISNDETGGFEKSKILFNKHKDAKNIIIDNTNPDIKTRKYWVNLARESGFSVIGVYFNYPKELGEYLLEYRNYLGKKFIPEMAIRMYYSRLEIPEESEFDYFIKIDKLFFELQELYF